MSYADCCAAANRNSSLQATKQQRRPNILQSGERIPWVFSHSFFDNFSSVPERYDRCTSENCMFCRESKRTDHLPTSALSQEIRKIPYRAMCRVIGAASDEVQILDAKSFIENGFKVADCAGYYTNGNKSFETVRWSLIPNCPPRFQRVHQTVGDPA
jgi:hypothetical protein